jgi:hypothetical protein
MGLVVRSIRPVPRQRPANVRGVRMNRSTRSPGAIDRVSSRRGLLSRLLGRKGRGARALVESAGHVEAQTFEALEPRQLLFTLTITNQTAYDAPSGLGRIDVDFGVVNPYLQFIQAPDPTNTPVYAQAISSRITLVHISFTGPIGATLDIRDLYGRAMRQTIALGIPPSADPQVTLVDANDDGVPDFNDGIGSITIRNANAKSSLLVIGGTLAASTTPPADADVTDPAGFYGKWQQTVHGNFDDFEAFGFGYSKLLNNGTPTVGGLPPGSGSVIIGSPWVRDNSSASAYRDPANDPSTPIRSGFSRVVQGIFVVGTSFGSINVAGIVHGLSKVDGSLDRFITGYMVGSLSVAGDLGTLISSTDAGEWTDDLNTTNANGSQRTGSQITVGRTLGQIQVAGRTSMDVTVTGDLSSPGSRPTRDVYKYYELEYAQQPFIIQGANNTPRQAIQRMMAESGAYYFAGGQFSGQSLIFGGGFFRNDTVLGSEFIGSPASATEIFGTLGGADPVNTNEDRTDVYAFPADGSQDIIVRPQNIIREGASLGASFSAARGTMFARIVDADGRTLASIGQYGNTTSGVEELRFRPEQAGVYYLVVQAASRGGTDAIYNIGYDMIVSGLAPVTMGLYRAGLTLGHFRTSGAFPASATISVLSGSVGQLRGGAGIVGSTTGADSDPSGEVNTINGSGGINNEMSISDSQISVRNGNLYNMTSGGDIKGSSGSFGNATLTLSVGGNLGTVVTGISSVLGVNVFQGDLRNVVWNIGGTIGELDIRGAIGLDQKVATFPKPTDSLGSVTIRTGRNSNLKGDVGLIRVGSNMGSDTFSLQTSNNSVVGGILISQDFTDNDVQTNGGFQGIYSGSATVGITLNFGINSDLRFFDTPRLDTQNIGGLVTVLQPGVPETFVDDAGAAFTITVVPGAGGTGTGSVVAVPRGSKGVAVARITVDLTGGASLQITSQFASGQTAALPTDIISIGQIQVTGADAGSSISISGPLQIDVYHIYQKGGTAFGTISNSTPNGDIVVADMATLTSLSVSSGDLGRTQLPTVGPRTLGPFVGITRTSGAADALYAPIAVDPNVTTGFWNGNLYRTLAGNVATTADTTNGAGDDVGMPVDPYLDGLRVRAGDIVSVSVGGAIGDVIDTAGTIFNVTANASGVNTPSKFRGIVGNIFGFRIGTVDVGDGLVGLTSSPLAHASIVATDDISTVTASRPGANIDGYIEAGNSTINADPATFPTDGINLVQITGGGSFVDAHIASMQLDDFWTSNFAADDAAFHGRIATVTTSGGASSDGQGNLFRSSVRALSIGNVSLRGAYDGSITNARGSVDSITALEYRNTTLGGGSAEQSLNEVTAGVDVTSLSTTGNVGDISDLTVQAFGRVNSINARNMSRSSVSATIQVVQVSLSGTLGGSSIIAGRLTSLTVGQRIVSSSIEIAGPIETMTAGESILNTSVTVTGPDGRIGMIVAQQDFTGTIISAGPIDTLSAINGDLRLNITTSKNLRGADAGVQLLSAGRDLVLSGDILGSVIQMRAGRNVGDPKAFATMVFRSDVTSISAPNGMLYSDFRFAKGLQSAVFGGAIDKPGNALAGTGSLIAYGRIESVTFGGDFAGRIISYSGGLGVITINNGSLLPAGIVAAYSGDLQNLFINSGNLYGTVHADWNILAIRLNASSDGVFGDLGVNPAFSANTSYNSTRNQLPPGVAPDSGFQGPSISAGRNIGRIILTNGSIFEAFIFAGRAIGTIDVTGNISNDNLTTGYGTVIAAGSTINVVHATGNVSDTAILAGVVSFGADNRPGGTGNNADTMQSGRITTVQVDRNGTNVAVVAGMNAGADGLLNTGDETKPLGISYIRTVTFGGTITNVTAFADSPTLTASSGIVLGGTGAPVADADVSDGTPAGVPLVSGVALHTTYNGDNLTILFSGPGTAFFDAATGRVLLINTKLNSNLTVTGTTPDNDTATLTNFKIATNNNASMGQITVNANLNGDSRVVVDAYVLGITTGNLSGTSQIKAGMNLRTLIVGVFASGAINGAFWVRDMSFTAVGVAGQPANSARIDALAGSTISIVGNDSGLINVNRDLASFTVGGTINTGFFRVGATVGTITIGAISGGRVTAGDSIGAITIFGNANQSNIQAGGDLGADAAPGGTLFNADSVRAGNIGNVTIGGNFFKSSLVAGMLRGPDGFFGTADDSIAPGLSNIGSVTIAGTQVGSNVFSEQYRIEASNTLGTVTIGGQTATSAGNFAVGVVPSEPSSIIVLDLKTIQANGIWTATFTFNQAIDVSTIGTSLTIAEVRDQGATLVPLVQGVDYFIGAFDPVLNTLQINFSINVTSRPLVPVSGLPGVGAPDPSLPGPGVFRFTLNGATLRASQNAARLDANNDGASSGGESYVASRVVGDAGDRFVDEIATVGGQTVNFYTPDDLDEVLRDPNLSTHVPKPNVTTTINGYIGDHPDQVSGLFTPSSDVDLYTITLQAGQILRLGAIEGTFSGLLQQGLVAPYLLYQDVSADGQGGNTDQSMQLPGAPGDYLIKVSGTYIILVGNFLPPESPSGVFSIDNGPGLSGDYSFTVQVFDDGNSGFAAGNSSGNAKPVPDAPAPGTFVLSSGVYQPQVIGDFIFTLNVGADGIRGTADDVVTGLNSDGSITSIGTGAGNTRTLKTVINSSIGPAGHSGLPGDVTPDVDVYALNNGDAIAAGRQVTVRVKLSSTGGDLGSTIPTITAGTTNAQLLATQFSTGAIQFGIFDITDASSIDDGLLVYSPSDFKASPQKSKTIASSTNSSYGYDANGDFYITFVTPGKLGAAPGTPAKYAIYLQGIFNSDYSIEYSQAPNVAVTAPAARRQNILIETRGGTIDWLQVGGLVTSLAPYTTSLLGFNGNIGGLTVDSYILSQVVANVQAMFSSVGLNVVVSSNPADFEFQQFSTIFLTSSTDPTSVSAASEFGYSQHSDPGNLDLTDEGVVFLPSFGLLSYSPTQAGADQLAQSISAAVARRSGELMGLRLTGNSSTLDTPIDVLSANSVINTPSATTYGIINSARPLSDPWDSTFRTDFFLGKENAFALLSKFTG